MNKKNETNKNKLQSDILELKKTLLNLMFQKFSGQLEKTSQIRNTRRQIARLKSKLSKEYGVKSA